MADLHETNNSQHDPQIDTLGWVFLAFAVVITGVAAMIAYEANETSRMSAPVSHLATR
jgi:hypothetical protein